MNFLDLTLPTPAENLACDEALLDWRETEGGGEILRFWESPEPFVVVGYANKVATEANVKACAENKIPILRRCSGGGTILQGPGVLNYALILKIEAGGPTGGINSANRFIMERNRAALEAEVRRQQPEARVSVSGHTDLAVDGLKFSGNAQRRKKDFLLFHGTFLLNCNLPQIEKYLATPSLQPDYRQGRAHLDFISNLQLPADAVKRSLCHAWQATDPLANFPTGQVALLTRDRYVTNGWNLKF